MKHFILIAALLVLPGLFLPRLCARELYQRQWSFENGHAGWIRFKSWPGKLETVTTQGAAFRGRGALILEPVGPADKDNARAWMLITPREPLSGCRFLVRGHVAGSGTLSAGCFRKIRAKGKNIQETLPAASWELTPEYREISFEIFCDRPGITSSHAEFRLKGGKAYFDQFSVQELPNRTCLSAETPFTVVPEGSDLPPLRFLTEKTGETVRLFSFAPGGEQTLRAGRSSGEKKIEFPGLKKSAAGEYLFRAVTDGAFSEVRMSVLPRKQFAGLAARANAFAGKKPMRILYLGDSLSDFLHDHNYTDKVNFFLNLHGKSSFRNAAVHGDYVTRTLQRMRGIHGGKKAFKQFRYQDLWKEEYDLIFIWLGHNDTVSNTRWSRDLSVPRILPPEQKKLYGELLGEIRRHSKARIILVSAASINFEQALKLSESMNRPDHMRYLFGRPELLEQWNRTLREIAAEQKTGYFDIYTPLAACPEKNTLFSPADGLHPTDQGHNFIAGLFLDYLKQFAD